MMIALFTDFGLRGPYVGQMKARLFSSGFAGPVVDLLHDGPAMDPRAAAYLLEPFSRYLPEGAVVLAVVDPGVGTEARDGCVIRADGRWFVGPDNGLFEFVQRRAAEVERWPLPAAPEGASPTFHGRDVFADIAAAVATGTWRSEQAAAVGPRFPDWGDDTPYVLYIDDYGNAMTGIRGEALADTAILQAGEHRLVHATTFGRMPAGAGFWHRNSSGLVEVSVNLGHAAHTFDLAPGSLVRLLRP